MNFNDPKYKATRKKVFNQLIAEGMIDLFDDLHSELVKYAVKNKLKKPGKGELVGRIFSEKLPEITLETYFKS